ncbi:hypothetical protein [Burkholderia cepacia]|uniref:hypothetical protein n=1 Tax=Burkholderia cepacia TaxID=292 RepID=UPI00075C1AC6|nr:hypothetical protein [Burkholderia cepacia]KWF99067.1 hypothetical protein WL95_00185 [Burkholderia cepacia]
MLTFSRPLLVTPGLREATTAARTAGLELSRRGGKWVLSIAHTDVLFEGRRVSRGAFGCSDNDVVGHFDTLQQVIYHCKGAVH